jgi:hypothetical protein
VVYEEADMNSFAMTSMGGVEVSRMIAGSNWFLGYAHQTRSKGDWIQQYQTRKNISDVLEVYLRAGINLAMGPIAPLLADALHDAEQRVGTKMHLITTPGWDLKATDVNLDSARKAFDECVKLGATFCWPHTSVTDRLYDGMTGTIRHMPEICREIRQRGLIPGLSTHLPEVIVAADRMDLDVASYISIYNAVGFLMNIEIDWVQKVIHNAKHPVTTIKPMAAGRVMPYVGLPFSWSTLRDIDLVTVGTVTPEEAKECIEISRAALERRQADRQLQYTRSKQTLTAAAK